IGGSYYYGGGLVWAPAPVSPPFWTSFVRSIEVLDGEFLPPQPDPDPDPDPEPGEQYVDVILHAEDYGAPGLGYTGFRAEIAGELEGFGSDVTLQFVIGGVLCTLDEISLSYVYNGTVFALHGVYGVTGASMVVDGVAFSMELATFE